MLDEITLNKSRLSPITMTASRLLIKLIRSVSLDQVQVSFSQVWVGPGLPAFK